MSNPEQIRADIEQTRRELGTNVDALADKVTPSKIIDRQTSKVRNAFSGTRDRLMGAASDATDAVSDSAEHVTEKAKGNPLAVGLIAFGVGWLAASLVPVTEKEKQLTGQLKDAAQPLMDDVTDAAKTVADHLQEPARDAVAAVKDSATDATVAVKNEASSAASDLQDSVQDAASHDESTGTETTDASDRPVGFSAP